MNTTTNRVLIALIVLISVLLGGMLLWTRRPSQPNPTGVAPQADNQGTQTIEQRGRPPESKPFTASNPGPVEKMPEYDVLLGDNVTFLQGVRAYVGDTVIWLNDTGESWTSEGKAIAPGDTFKKQFTTKGQFTQTFSGSAERPYNIIVIERATDPPPQASSSSEGQKPR